MPTQHPDLLAVADAKLRCLAADGLPGVRAYRTEREVFGVRRTVLVTWNRKLFDAQRKTLLREIEKRRQLLRALQRQLRRWRAGKIRRGRAEEGGRLAERAAHGRAVPGASPEGERPAEGELPLPAAGVGAAAAHAAGQDADFQQQRRLGRPDLVRGYRAQHHVESAFRPLKDTDCIAIRPQYHWTDQKIRVHVFCCVLALTLCGLLRREASRQGIERSVPALLAELGGIREVDVLYPLREDGAEPELRTTLSQMSAEQ